MKKNYLLFIILISLTSVAFALDKQHVYITQWCQKPGGQYAELTTPQLPSGKINLKYDFTVEGKDDKHSVIDCIMKFPKDLDIGIVSCTGIQGLSSKDDGTVAALTIFADEEYQYCEFLIPQKNRGQGFVEFQVNIPTSNGSKNIPIELNFEHFKKPFFLRYGTGIGIGVGIVAGVVTGMLTFNPATGVAAGLGACGAVSTVTTSAIGLGSAIALGTGVGIGTAAATSYISYEVIQDSMQEMKNKYKSSKMNDSYTKFTLQVK